MGLLSSLAIALNVRVGNSALERWGPMAILIAILLMILGYLFGLIPSDRFTGLLTLLGGTVGGAAIRHMGDGPIPPKVDVGPIGEISTSVGKSRKRGGA